MILVQLLLFCVATLADPSQSRDCLPGEQGTPGIRYYLDMERMESYPYYYKGCGVEPWFDFTTREGPFSRLPPTLKAGSGCQFYLNDDVISCASNEGINGYFGCPAGHYCTEGRCCNIDVRKRFERNRLALQCPSGTYPKIYENGDIMFGRSCTHNFCGGDRCVQEEFNAYCCL